MNQEQKLIQAVKTVIKNDNMFLIDFEKIICDDGHGVICMICYWFSNKYSIRKQEYDHDKFDDCKYHIFEKHSLAELKEYLEKGT